MGFCWKNHQRFCPRCKNRKLYTLSNGKRRCSRCKYTFHDFSQRFINHSQLSCRQWLRFLKLFELEVPPEQMASQLDISYNTVRKALIISRLAILAHCTNAPQIFSSLSLLTLLGNQEKPHFINPILGIREEGEQAFVEYLPHFTLESILHFSMECQLQTNCYGHVVYTDKYKQYLGLVLYDTGLFGRYRLRPSNSPLALELESHFWDFALPRLQHFKDQNPLKLFLYLKELQFRYNQRHLDIFSSLASLICSFVPSLE